MNDMTVSRVAKMSSRGGAPAFAATVRFKTFAISYAVSYAVIYPIAQQMNWPLFTFHPAICRVDFLWAAARGGEGPAMYWYGWTASAMLGGFATGLVSMILPESMIRRIPHLLLWLLPTLAFLPLVQSLMPYWTKG
jgi:hypothetical protein